MDREIILHSDALQAIADRLMEDGDISTRRYRRVLCKLEDARDMLLEADKAYDAKIPRPKTALELLEEGRHE